ncbi:MAG: peptidase M3, partial [Chloroflexota bacterium]|nr:peptidase M3 [Chloroflexota bacterium]
MTTATPDAPAELAARNRDRISRAATLLGRIATEGGDTSAVLPTLNDMGVELATAGAECSLLSEVHPDALVRAAAEEIVREVTAFSTELQQHRGLYDALGALDEASLDELERRVVFLQRRDMKRAGVELAGSEQQRVRELRQELV